MTAFDRAVARVNEIAGRDTSDREKLYEYLVAILDTQLADLIRNGELRTSGFTETADLLDAPFTDDDIEHLAAAVRVRIGWSISQGEAHTIVMAVAQELAATGQHRGKTTTAPR